MRQLQRALILAGTLNRKALQASDIALMVVARPVALVNAVSHAPSIAVVRLDSLRDADLPLPHYATSGAAGADVCAALTEALQLAPMGRARVPTGLILEIPHGFEVQVRPRSGLAWRSGLTVLNAPGTIDSDYRGELQVLLVNLGPTTATISRGDRIAQLVVARVQRAQFAFSDHLSATARADGGFGSTGT